MQTFRFVAARAMLLLLSSFLLFNCVAAGENCLRFTDCAEGLTCTSGRCVSPFGDSGTDASSVSDSASGVAEAAAVAEAASQLPDAAGAVEASSE